MKICFISIGSGFIENNESEFDFLKNNQANEIDIISIDMELGDTPPFLSYQKQGKTFNIHRVALDVNNKEHLNKEITTLFKKINGDDLKNNYDQIIILDSIHFNEQFKYSKIMAMETTHKLFPETTTYQIHYISPQCKDPTLNGQPIDLSPEIKDKLKSTGHEMVNKLPAKQQRSIEQLFSNSLSKHTTLADLYDDLKFQIEGWESLNDSRQTFLVDFFKTILPQIGKIVDEFYRNTLSHHLEKIEWPSKAPDQSATTLSELKEELQKLKNESLPERKNDAPSI